MEPVSLDLVDHGPRASRETNRLFGLLGARATAWSALCILEAISVSWLFELPYWFSAWGNPFTYMRQAVVWAIISAAAFGVLVWPRRHELVTLWQSEQAAHRWRPALILNLVLLACLLPATQTLTVYSKGLAEAPIALLTMYVVLLCATGVSMLRIDIGFGGAMRIARAFASEALIAGCAGLAVLAMSLLSLHSWGPMATATLTVAKSMLELFEADVAVDPDQRMLRIGDFAVIVTRDCSGYEGIALVVAFLSIYLWVFRSSMRFPRAFWLYPIGIVSIWLLNSARIAALASLGAHVSPDIAVKGFHSQAGWIAFIAATIGIMALAQRSAFCIREPRVAVVRAQTSDRVLLAYVAPFMALMAASIAMSAVAPFDRPLYVLKVIAVGAVLWLYRDVYRGMVQRVPFEAYAAGLLVGIVWIATDPGTAAGGDLGTWIAQQSPLAVAGWLAIRVIGASVTVPIAEELAFRGLLHRWLIAREFDRVPFERFTPVALVVSSVLFGAMHGRWLAGILAGAVFALVMYRTRSIAGPIVAHMTANALICLWAIVFRQWSLL